MTEKSNIVGIIGCAKSKTLFPGPAKMLYAASRYFNLTLERALKECDTVKIFSIMKGTIDLEEVLEPYEVLPKDATDEDKIRGVGLLVDYLDRVEATEIRLYLTTFHWNTIDQFTPRPIDAIYIPWGFRKVLYPEPRAVTIGAHLKERTNNVRKSPWRNSSGFTAFIDYFTGIDSRTMSPSSLAAWMQKYIWDRGPVTREEFIKVSQEEGFTDLQALGFWHQAGLWYAHALDEEGRLYNRYRQSALEKGVEFNPHSSEMQVARRQRRINRENWNRQRFGGLAAETPALLPPPVEKVVEKVVCIYWVDGGEDEFPYTSLEITNVFRITSPEGDIDSFNAELVKRYKTSTREKLFRDLGETPGDVPEG